MVGDDFEPPSWLFGRDLSQTAWKGREHVWQAMISNTCVLSPTKLNEFRFGTDYFLTAPAASWRSRSRTPDVNEDAVMQKRSADAEPGAQGLEGR